MDATSPTAERRMIMACLHEKELEYNQWCPVTCFYCTGDQKRRCKHNRATNADRIRAMNDEELGMFLAEWAEKPWTWKKDGEGQCLAWLQSPAE